MLYFYCKRTDVRSCVDDDYEHNKKIILCTDLQDNVSSSQVDEF